jgi:hypothetical protein
MVGTVFPPDVGRFVEKLHFNLNLQSFKMHLQIVTISIFDFKEMAALCA